jgi:hypothetical protein
MRLLDLGGGLFFWRLAANLQFRLPQITILNVRPCAEKLPGNMKWVIADGTRLPFRSQSFDVVFCNSVIEHLAEWDAQVQLASEIQRVGRGHFVQTPLKGFPIEPHFIAPGIHWLPAKMQRKLVRNFTPWGWITRPSHEECDRILAELRLLTRKEMAELFPTSDLQVERFGGWPKSVIAVKCC